MRRLVAALDFGVIAEHQNSEKHQFVALHKLPNLKQFHADESFAQQFLFAGSLEESPLGEASGSIQLIAQGEIYKTRDQPVCGNGFRQRKLRSFAPVHRQEIQIINDRTNEHVDVTMTKRNFTAVTPGESLVSDSFKFPAG